MKIFKKAKTKYKNIYYKRSAYEHPMLAFLTPSCYH